MAAHHECANATELCTCTRLRWSIYVSFSTHLAIPGICSQCRVSWRVSVESPVLQLGLLCLWSCVPVQRARSPSVRFLTIEDMDMAVREFADSALTPAAPGSPLFLRDQILPVPPSMACSKTLRLAQRRPFLWHPPWRQRRHPFLGVLGVHRPTGLAVILNADMYLGWSTMKPPLTGQGQCFAGPPGSWDASTPENGVLFMTNQWKAPIQLNSGPSSIFFC